MSEADEANEAKDLAVSSASMLFAALGAVLAPTAAIPTGVAATGIKQFADTIRNRREAKRLRRLEAMVNSLSARFADHVAEHEFTEDDQDLFLWVLEAFLADDEELKQPMYEAVLEWMIREDPLPMLIRMLANAVRNLSYLELWCFVRECAGRSMGRKYEPHIEQVVLWTRLTGAGLSQGGVQVSGNPTKVGNLLLKYINMDSLPEPLGPPPPRRT